MGLAVSAFLLVPRIRRIRYSNKTKISVGIIIFLLDIVHSAPPQGYCQLVFLHGQS